MNSTVLDVFFNPKTIAVIGASNQENSVGNLVFDNLITAGFQGKIYPVNPKHTQIKAYPCYPNILLIAAPIDLALIVLPATIVPHVIRQCGEARVKNIIILSAGFSETGPQGTALEQEIIILARKYQMRLLGPNCLGILCPQSQLNATFMRQTVKSGSIALVTQSGAILAMLLDWAAEKKIGFSKLISLGNSADLEVAELLEYLALDPQTESIVLYIEGIRRGYDFKQALAKVTTHKPVIVVKAGRKDQGKQAAISHTGAIINNEDVFDAVLQQAGAVRAYTTTQLFLATEMLAVRQSAKGNRLAIITNSGGPAVMAADYAEELGIVIPNLNEFLTNELSSFLPSHWSRHNPIDILGDATPARFKQVISSCLKTNDFDALLIMLTPLPMSDPLEIARTVITSIKQNKTNKVILVAWLGEQQVKTAWRLFATAQIPCFQTPELAIEAFSYLTRYRHNIALPITPTLVTLNSQQQKIKTMIEAASQQGRKILTPIESKIVLAAFNIPVIPTQLARTPEEIITAANKLGFPLAMKIHSPTITHKRDVGGVRLNVISKEMALISFQELIANAKKHYPDAVVDGVMLEPMHHKTHGRELLIGILQDPIFGPVISFGTGGTFVEIWHDRAIALAPLNERICQQLIQRTKIARTLDQFRNMPPINMTALIDILLRISVIACTFPEIKELDINPLIADADGCIALDARIVVSQTPVPCRLE